MKIIIPKNEHDFNLYYDFRWQKLRKNLNKPKGTEKDSLEDESYHLMLMENNKVVGVGRIHFIINNLNKKAQIRYMAIDEDFQNRGYGSLLLLELEKIALKNNISHVFLHARENAINFYLKNNYKKNKKSHLLFNSIQHWLMDKKI